MSHKASDGTPRSDHDSPRKIGADTAQALRVDAAAYAAMSQGKPCEHGTCGFEGPWYCGCLCVRKGVADHAANSPADGQSAEPRPGDDAGRAEAA